MHKLNLNLLFLKAQGFHLPSKNYSYEIFELEKKTIFFVKCV